MVYKNEEIGKVNGPGIALISPVEVFICGLDYSDEDSTKAFIFSFLTETLR
jgi:hypothetical protein